jgi:hypothetical protein
MSWVVKGYIAQRKSIDINWAKAVPSILKEKVCQVEMEKMKSSYSNFFLARRCFAKPKVILCARIP